MSSQQKFYSLLEGFSHAMLVTLSPNAEIVARPMRILEVKASGSILMLSKRSTEKVQDIQDNHLVCLTMQERDRTFVSVTGTGFVRTDPAELQRLWTDELAVWLPEGPQSPEASVLEIEPLFGEYWDNSGWQRIKLALEHAKVLGGESKGVLSPDQHDRVDFLNRPEHATS